MIEFNRLRKEYSELVAVEDLTLVIPAGEVFGLIGPNGAGKTTTLRMACGLLTPTSGSVKISGVDVSLDPERREMGRDLQRPLHTSPAGGREVHGHEQDFHGTW